MKINVLVAENVSMFADTKAIALYILKNFILLKTAVARQDAILSVFSFASQKHFILAQIIWKSIRGYAVDAANVSTLVR
jgi:hypothetical protein